jgi:hypothetical protein
VLQVISSVLCQLILDDGSDICSKILKLKSTYLPLPLTFIRSAFLALRYSCQKQNINCKDLDFVIFRKTSAKGEVSLVSVSHGSNSRIYVFRFTKVRETEGLWLCGQHTNNGNELTRKVMRFRPGARKFVRPGYSSVNTRK